MSRRLTVWWDEEPAGVLAVDQDGDLSFTYSESWLADPVRGPLSASLPKRTEPFSRKETRPFFAGLLPEEAQRDGVARALGISRANDFRLLEALGGDVAGALALWPEGDTPPSHPLPDAVAPLSDSDVEAILEALPQRPFLAGRDGLRLSLAGAQQKLPVVVEGGRIALPAPGQPSTHILKPPIAHFTGTTDNEALAMQLARAVGLDVADAAVGRVGSRGFLLVKRYDRIETVHRLRRIHQEDFCQALGRPPEHKYAAEGGPTFRTSFKLLRDVCAAPARDVLRLVDAAIFNVLIGNADAHGKNYSLLYGPAGATLAPLYDLMCTAAYEGVTPKLAMKVGGRSRLNEFRADTWDAFADEAGVPKPYVRRRVRDLAERTRASVADVASRLMAQGGDASELARFEALIEGRAAHVLTLGKA